MKQPNSSYEHNQFSLEISPRQARIRELISDGAFLTVEELAQCLSVAPQTIRRDVNALCDLGLARRRHGGVERPVERGNLAYAARRKMNQSAKQLIAATVASRIPDKATLSFGIGTTPAMVANALLKHKGLRIFTNNLSAALIATTGAGFDVNIAGGHIRNSDQDITGPEAESFFASYQTDFGIFGVGGVDPDGCLLDFSEEEVRIRQRICENCRESILVLDASKFSRVAHVRGGWLSDVDTVVCDTSLPVRLENTLTAYGRNTIACDRMKAK